MIDLLTLHQLQVEFVQYLKESTKEFTERENLRKEFIRLFSQDYLSQMPIEKFVIGETGRKESFCYWLEGKLKSLGDIRGGTAFKFGIYYGVEGKDTEKKYRYTNKFGNSQDEVYENVKREIIKLLKSGADNNIDEIKDNRLSPMFKGKILNIYYPDLYLNVFSNEHLSYFLEVFGLTSSGDEIDKRERLKHYKNNDSIMKTWSLPAFGVFLYREIKKPIKSSEVSEQLKKYVDDYVPFENIKYSFVKYEFSQLDKEKSSLKSHIQGKEDFDEIGRKKRILGSRGEDIVLKAEKDSLLKLGLSSLADKVIKVSDTSDSYGYDILSFDKEGQEKHIEVKSTNSDKTSFYISANEYEKCLHDGSYSIYLVIHALSKEPKIIPLSSINSVPEVSINIQPQSYRIDVGIKVLTDLNNE